MLVETLAAELGFDGLLEQFGRGELALLARLRRVDVADDGAWIAEMVAAPRPQ